MTKKMIVIACMLCMGAFLPVANAEDFAIKDYIFTWYVANDGTSSVEIQKSPEGLSVILKSMGGPLTTLYVPPTQAQMIGEVLRKTEDYYREQKESDDLKSSRTIRSGIYKITFSSRQGSSFTVEIAETKVFGSAALWSKDTALKLGKYLRKAEAMAAFADKRIRP